MSVLDPIILSRIPRPVAIEPRRRMLRNRWVSLSIQRSDDCKVIQYPVRRPIPVVPDNVSYLSTTGCIVGPGNFLDRGNVVVDDIVLEYVSISGGFGRSRVPEPRGEPVWVDRVVSPIDTLWDATGPQRLRDEVRAIVPAIIQGRPIRLIEVIDCPVRGGGPIINRRRRWNRNSALRNTGCIATSHARGRCIVIGNIPAVRELVPYLGWSTRESYSDQRTFGLTRNVNSLPVYQVAYDLVIGAWAAVCAQARGTHNNMISGYCLGDRGKSHSARNG